MNKEYSEKWLFRFAFFERTLGKMGSPAYRDEFKKLTFGQRIKVNFNFFAFFFGIIYLCILGLWKKGLVLFAVACLFGFALGLYEAISGATLDSAARVIGIMYSVACASIANYAWFLKERKGICGWNPLEGMTRKSAARLANLPDIDPQ